MNLTNQRWEIMLTSHENKLGICHVHVLSAIFVLHKKLPRCLESPSGAVGGGRWRKRMSRKLSSYDYTVHTMRLHGSAAA